MNDITISNDEVEVMHGPAPVSHLALIERAIASGAGIETLEKLMALHERAEERRARQAFVAAMCKARAEIKPIIKNASVNYVSGKGRVSYEHETLDAIAAQIDPILAKHGLSYRFRSAQSGSHISVSCVVSHIDGHVEEGEPLSGPHDQSGSKNAYQAIGSGISYLCRYTLRMALGLSAAKDDDATSAGPQQRQEPQRQSPQEGPDQDAIGHAVGSLQSCETLDALRNVWSDLPALVKRVPAVSAAKDAAKAAIDAGKSGQIVDNGIPF